MAEILYTKQTQQRAYLDQILLSYFDSLVCYHGITENETGALLHTLAYS